MHGEKGVGPRVTDVLGLVGSIVVLLGGVFLPASPGLEYRTQLVLAVFLSTVILWMTKPIPYSISSLLCVVLLYALGLTPTFGDAVTGFSSTLVFFLILLLLVGKSITKVGLDELVAARLVSTTSTPSGSIRRLAATVLLLVFVMPSGMARTVAFLPVVDEINDLYDLKADSHFRRLGYYVIGHLNPVGSLALMTGGGMAITAAEMINSEVRPITWVEWALYMAPPTILLFATAAAAASFLYAVDDAVQIAPQRMETDGARAPDGTDAAGLDAEQKLVVGALVAAIVAWVVGSFLGVPAIVPAMAVVAVFSLPGVRIVTARELRTINWEIIVLLGTMLSLLEVMQDANAFDPVIAVLATALPADAHPGVVLFLLFASAALLRGAFSSVAASYLISLPIVLRFSTELGANELYVSFGLAMVVMSSTILPFNNPTVLLAYERGPLRAAEVLLLGLLTLAVGFLVLALSWNVYWPLVDGLSPIP